MINTDNLSLIESIESIVADILKSKQALTKEAAIKLPDIITAIKQKNFSVNDSTVAAYLSKLSRLEISCIKSAGKKRGFFYQSKIETNSADPLNTDALKNNSAPAGQPPLTIDPKQKNYKETEKKLYEMVQMWLETENYNVDITAHNLKNGKWGNPDITGIKVLDTVTESKEIEITTIEVKSGRSQWRQYIFEAVSHTRFANLTYYCFAYPEAERNSLEQELFLYAEEFGIGLLGIEMTDDDYERFINEDYAPTFGDVDIIELQTPRHKVLRPYFREEFLTSLGIKGLKDLILWPKKPRELKSA